MNESLDGVQPIKPIEQPENREPVAQARDEMTIKLETLQSIAGYTSEMDIARVTVYLTLDHIKLMGETVFKIEPEKLAAIGEFLTVKQLEYIGVDYFIHNFMTPEKIQLVSKFTEDQLDAFCAKGKKAGSILLRLVSQKIKDMGRLSPETILVLADTRIEELITSPPISSEWDALMDYNIDYVNGVPTR